MRVKVNFHLMSGISSISNLRAITYVVEKKENNMIRLILKNCFSRSMWWRKTDVTKVSESLLVLQTAISQCWELPVKIKSIEVEAAEINDHPVCKLQHIFTWWYKFWEPFAALVPTSHRQNHVEAVVQFSKANNSLVSARYGKNNYLDIMSRRIMKLEPF